MNIAEINQKLHAILETSCQISEIDRQIAKLNWFDRIFMLKSEKRKKRIELWTLRKRLVSKIELQIDSLKKN
jgi:hypothetical protein